MIWDDVLKSGIGAILGFSLAQMVNIVTFAYNFRRRPILSIEKPAENCRLLRHGAEVGNGEILDEEIYGFSVRNTGKSIATGVRFQITSISVQDSSTKIFRYVTQHSMDLAVHENAARIGEKLTTSIVPGASVKVGLAWWRDGEWSIKPSTRFIPDYYDETCERAERYKFAVTAYDDKGRFVTADLEVETPD